MFHTIQKSIETHFAKVLVDNLSTPEEQAMPPYLPDTVVFALYLYQGQPTSPDTPEANSLHFIALGDCERPALCGVDVQQLNQYEKTHRTLSSVTGVLGSIRCNRLRIPFGKSKLATMLKRAYNAEKNNPNNELNQPTRSLLVVHAFTDGGHAEETYHTLSMVRRVSSVLGGGSVGPSTRDLATEKWRLEQDIVELKDELTIAKAVHDYRPCIYDQAKTIQNIQEEETKRIAAIQKKREEARERAQQEIRQRAEAEAKQIIEEEERRTATTLAELEAKLAQQRAQNTQLQAERANKMKDYEKHLEKLRKKREEEENATVKLREEIRQMEGELSSRQAAIEAKRKQLEIATQDHAKGRDAILKEREEIKQQRTRLFEERRKQREQWLAKIQETNQQLLNQVIQLTKERQAKKDRDGVASATAEEEAAVETEETVRLDIESINKYLPKLVALDDVPADIEATETIRQQLETYFEDERTAYSAKLQEEKLRKEKLETAIEEYRSRVAEQQTRQKKEHLAEAMKKEHHLQTLVDQVVQYLQHGLRMYKVSSKGNIRRRYFFLSEDCKRIFACELDDAGMPVNRKKPTTIILLKDVIRVVMGMYTPNFQSFAGGESALRQQRDDAMRRDGCYNPDPTVPLTQHNIGRYNYRAFAFEFRDGKTLELVCESDNDCEAWVVALKRLFYWKTDYERRRDAAANKPTVQAAAEIKWGAPLELRGRSGVSSLTVEEAKHCSDNHIAPELFLKAKSDIMEKSQLSIVTVYDVRVSSTLDLIRAQVFYEFLVENKLIAGTH